MSTPQVQEKIDRALSNGSTVLLSTNGKEYVGKLVALDGENYGKVKVVTGKRGRPAQVSRDDVTDVIEVTAAPDSGVVQDDGSNNVLFERDVEGEDPFEGNSHGNEDLIASSEDFHNQG